MREREKQNKLKGANEKGTVKKKATMEKGDANKIHGRCSATSFQTFLLAMQRLRCPLKHENYEGVKKQTWLYHLNRSTKQLLHRYCTLVDLSNFKTFCPKTPDKKTAIQGVMAVDISRDETFFVLAIYNDHTVFKVDASSAKVLKVRSLTWIYMLYSIGTSLAKDNA